VSDLVEMKCPSCGRAVQGPRDPGVTRCPYCGSTVWIEGDAVDAALRDSLQEVLPTPLPVEPVRIDTQGDGATPQPSNEDIAAGTCLHIDESALLPLRPDPAPERATGGAVPLGVPGGVQAVDVPPRTAPEQAVAQHATSQAKGEHAMVDSITCPSCKTQNAMDATFCQACGKRITGAMCRRCQIENARQATFCRNCGIKLSDATLGLSPERAAEWARIFVSDGYPPLSGKARDSWNDWARRFSLPLFGDNKEVIALDLGIGKQIYWPKWVEYHWPADHPQLPNRKSRVKSGELLMTSWRLVATGFRDAAVYLPYEHLAEITSHKLLVTLRTTPFDGASERVLRIQLQYRKTDLFDYFTMGLGGPQGMSIGAVSGYMEGSTRATANLVEAFLCDVVATVNKLRGS